MGVTKWKRNRLLDKYRSAFNQLTARVEEAEHLYRIAMSEDEKRTYELYDSVIKARSEILEDGLYATLAISDNFETLQTKFEMLDRMVNSLLRADDGTYIYDEFSSYGGFYDPNIKLNAPAGWRREEKQTPQDIVSWISSFKGQGQQLFVYDVNGKAWEWTWSAEDRPPKDTEIDIKRLQKDVLIQQTIFEELQTMIDERVATITEKTIVVQGCIRSVDDAITELLKDPYDEETANGIREATRAAVRESMAKTALDVIN